MSHIPHSHSTWSSSWDAPAICQASPMPGGEGFPKKQPKLLIPYLQLILSCHSGNKNGHQKRKNNSLEEVILCNPSNLSSNVPHPYLPLSKVEWFLKKTSVLCTTFTMASPTWITINVKNRSPAVQSHAIPAMRSNLRCYCAAGFRTRFLLM